MLALEEWSLLQIKAQLRFDWLVQLVLRFVLEKLAKSSSKNIIQLSFDLDFFRKAMIWIIEFYLLQGRLQFSVDIFEDTIAWCKSTLVARRGLVCLQNAKWSEMHLPTVVVWKQKIFKEN